MYLHKNRQDIWYYFHARHLRNMQVGDYNWICFRLFLYFPCSNHRSQADGELHSSLMLICRIQSNTDFSWHFLNSYSKSSVDKIQMKFDIKQFMLYLQIRTFWYNVKFLQSLNREYRNISHIYKVKILIFQELPFCSRNFFCKESAWLMLENKTIMARFNFH